MSGFAMDALKPLLAKLDPALARLSVEELATALGYNPDGQAAIASAPARWEDQLIQQIIPQGATVLDLGCGEGELLAKLQQNKSVRGQGVELDETAAFACIARDVPIFQIDLDSGLKEFTDDSFDYVVLEETLQTLRKPIDLLQEMLRVGRRGIVSFPNFGFWKVRLDLLLRGKMPVTEQLPHRWYNTPNIHLMTLQDFLDWVHQHRVKIAQAHVFAEGHIRPMQDGDNLYAEQCLLVLER
jgi:methionine biosynthesis protein MetW